MIWATIFVVSCIANVGFLVHIACINREHRLENEINALMKETA